MNLPLSPPYAPMEALPVSVLPRGPDWQYEPKWDGFRCLAFRDHQDVKLQSKSLKALERYFPDVIEALKALRAETFVLDGELVVPNDGALSFEELQLRLHPAASRVRKLAHERPAMLVVFDLLVASGGQLFAAAPLHERRARLERFAQKYLAQSGQVRLSAATRDAERASRWLREAAPGFDGVVAKRTDAGYAPGERTAMQKVKPRHTAECVVAGYRHATRSQNIGSLLLGLYGDDRLLHYVGFAANLDAPMRHQLTRDVGRLEAEPAQERGFSGRSPGGPSRWSSGRATEWFALPPRWVAEVAYDHFSGGRFRHGVQFLRWRFDKSPHQCDFSQIFQPAGSPLWLLQ